MLDLRVFPDRARLSRAVAEALVESICERTSGTDRFSLALAGGNTPRPVYESLGTEFRSEVPWHRVHFFFSDERYVPPDHPDSNYGLVKEALFDQIDLPVSNVHRPQTDMDDPEEAAARYEMELRAYFQSGEPRLDGVLLGLGEDGHVASLFPRSSALEEAERWVIVIRDSPRPPPLRLTLTLGLINRARRVHFLVAGTSKAEALRSTLEGPRRPLLFPAQNVKPFGDAPTWWIDEDAARDLMARKRRSFP